MLFDEKNTPNHNEEQRKALSGAYTILFAKSVRSGDYAEEGVEKFGDRLKSELLKHVDAGALSREDILEAYSPIAPVKPLSPPRPDLVESATPVAVVEADKILDKKSKK